jgi:predicted nucleotide-binding protein (sugar kinase/HSP70/actin superfamily)
MSDLQYAPDGRLLFTRKMRKTYKILIPQMLPIHFALLEQVLRRHGYDVELLTTEYPQIVTEGLQSVHNDTCYPALLVIGQMLDALKSGKYDMDRVALMITQTGGGCRASNYIHLLRKALKRNGLEHIPVISLNLSGMEKNPGFKMTPPLLYELICSLFYGDVLMDLRNQIRPYELQAGQTDALTERWVAELSRKLSLFHFKRAVRKICAEYGTIPVDRSAPKPRVGVVGEIYIKYAPLGNNDLEAFLRSQDAEVVVPGVMGFIQFMCDHNIADTKYYGVKRLKGRLSGWLLKLLCYLENQVIAIFKEQDGLRASEPFMQKKSLIGGYVSELNKMGEGWLLTAEMLELIHSGAQGIVCTQPFGCLPNHIVGKGMIRAIRRRNPGCNIVAIDYDPGATRINQENRIKLMMCAARGDEENTEWPLDLPRRAESAEEEAARISRASHMEKRRTITL